MSDLLTIPGIGPATKAALKARGIHTKSDLSQMRVEDLLTIRGVSVSRAEAIIGAAQDLPVDPSERAVQTEATPAPPPAAEARGAPGMQPEQKTPESAFEPESDAEPDLADNVVRLNPKAVKVRAKSRLKTLKQEKKKAKAKLETAKVKLKAAIKALEKAKKAAKKEKKAALKLRSAKKKPKRRRKA